MSLIISVLTGYFLGPIALAVGFWLWITVSPAAGIVAGIAVLFCLLALANLVTPIAEAALRDIGRTWRTPVEPLATTETYTHDPNRPPRRRPLRPPGPPPRSPLV